MKPGALARLRRIVEDTTSAQGVPFHLEDPATCRKVAALLDAGDTANEAPTARRQSDAA